MRRARRLSGVDRGSPASEELKRLFRARAGLGGVGEERQPGVRGEVQPVVGEVEVADDGMVEVLDAGVVKADDLDQQGLSLRAERCFAVSRN